MTDDDIIGNDVITLLCDCGHTLADHAPSVADDPVGHRFWSKVDKDGPVSSVDGTSCWLWTGATNGQYGQIKTGGKQFYAHRFAYELLVSPIPPGLHLDHRAACPKRCVNPSHLRPATMKQNLENRAGANRNNKSGVRGVVKEGPSWVGYVHHLGKTFRLGAFKTIEAAEAAVVARRNELFTHNDTDRP